MTGFKFWRTAIAPTVLLIIAVSTAPVFGLPTPKLYWDVNGDFPGGSFDNFYDGAWGTDSFWTTDASGSSPTTDWVPGGNAVFSAGSNTDADAYVVISGTQLASSIVIDEGIVRFRNGTVDTGIGTVTVNAGATLDLDRQLRLNNDGKVILNGGTLLSSNPFQAGSLIGFSKNLEVVGQGMIGYDDGDGMSDNKISTYFGIISGTGGTTSNGGAGTLVKIGPDQIGIQARDVGGGVNSQSQFTFSKLVVKQGGYRGRGATIGGFFQLDERVFGAVPLAVLPDAITLDGGGIGVNLTTTLHPNRGITIGPNGGYLDHGATGRLSIPGPLSGTGTLTIGNPTSSVLTNVIFTLSNPNNISTFSGAVVGVRGVLQLDSSLHVARLVDGVTNNASISIASGQTLLVGEPSGGADWSGAISGAGALTKIGGSAQVLRGLSTYTGDTSVQGGTLIIVNPYLADGADVYLSTGATFGFSFIGTDVIRSLYINNVLQPAGTWGAPGSGAQFTTQLISDVGLLRATVGVPEPASIFYCGLLAYGTLLIRRRCSTVAGV